MPPRLLRPLLFAIALPALAHHAAVFPQTTHSLPAPSSTRYEFSLDSQQLAHALSKFSHLTGQDYLTVSALLQNQYSPALNGHYTAEQALATLLSDSELAFKRNAQGTFVIYASQHPEKVVIKQLPVIDEIIVTAQKRHQALSEIPVAMSAFDGTQLKNLKRQHIQQLVEITPSLSFHGAISSAGQALHIRGIGSGVIASGIEQSVSTIIDGVVTGPSGSGLQDLWDVARIEVLRGPQGTLFGKNVSAGAVHYISQGTHDSFAARLDYDYEASLHAQRVEGMVNLPLTEQQQVRFAGFYLKAPQGDINNTVTQQDENTRQHSGLRAKWDYTHNSFWLKTNLAFHQVDDRCCARVFSHIENEQLSGFGEQHLTPALTRNHLLVDSSNTTAITDGQLYEQSDTVHAVIDSGYSTANGHTFKSILGARRWDHKSGRDADNIDQDIVWVKDNRTLSLTSQEFQWLSPTYSRWEHLLGLYFYQQHFPSTEWIGGGSSVFDDSGITTVSSIIRNRHAAIFGHGKWKISDHWSLSGGARWLTEEISGSGQQTGDNWIWPTDYTQNQISTQDADATGSLSLQWHPTDSHHFFINTARGYKGAAIDNTSNSIFYRAPFTTPDNKLMTVDDSLLAPETVFNKELGAKLHLLDRHVFISAVAFHSNFKNYQASAYDGNSNAFRLQNAGEVVSQGIELEVAAELFSGISLDASTTYTDARFKNFDQVPCQVQQADSGECDPALGQDISGQRLNETPQWQSFISVSKDFYSAVGIWSGQVNYAWRDDVIFDQDQDPNTRQPAYGLLGARIALELSDNWEVNLYGNNLTNENYAVRIIDSPIWRGSFQRYPGEGRRWGVGISWNIE